MNNHRPRGNAAVEFAVALPFLALILAGIIDFGRGYSLRVSLTNAAMEGARYAASNPDDTPGITTRVSDELVGGNINSVSTAVSPTVPTAGNPVEVTVSYTWKPFLGSILGVGNQTLRARSTMVVLPG
ncbi:MAG: pilus assembly protein [Armatimonadetes bacterium]|nr:pilus assembly protein [Armatimonadota bacterium]